MHRGIQWFIGFLRSAQVAAVLLYSETNVSCAAITNLLLNIQLSLRSSRKTFLFHTVFTLQYNTWLICVYGALHCLFFTVQSRTVFLLVLFLFFSRQPLGSRRQLHDFESCTTCSVPRLLSLLSLCSSVQEGFKFGVCANWGINVSTQTKLHMQQVTGSMHYIYRSICTDRVLGNLYRGGSSQQNIVWSLLDEGGSSKGLGCQGNDCLSIWGLVENSLIGKEVGQKRNSDEITYTE